MTKGSFEDHLRDLDKVLEKVETSGLKINATKSNFAAHELEYLGYWISWDGIQPLAAKVEAIKKMVTSKNKKVLRSFIGMINYYCDMLKKRSELLAPLTSLTSNKCKWDWTDKHQKMFEAIKNVFLRKTLLSYPDFNQPFDIHTDASDFQLGAVIIKIKKQSRLTARS